jgi:ketosteroid isomerase-like protein
MRIISNSCITILILIISCNRKESDIHLKEVSIKDLEKTEIAFSKMASDSGIQIAFTHFAHENAIIKRQNDTLIRGILGIQNFYKDKKLKDVKLIWKPDFVDVAASGELGYTYGKYEYIQKDSIGKDIIFKGVFHTVWKKNQNGDWRFVWD